MESLVEEKHVVEKKIADKIVKISHKKSQDVGFDSVVLDWPANGPDH